ncbi:hypothetical protein [Dactylosporangium sp. NPDC051541]|uniref:hypothetical protein n=1 Tax=Dactylosporangium sp. NPDC051541 TaxID=3363977 RepID=UPI0037A67844
MEYPDVTDADVTTLIDTAVQEVLGLAAGWLGWDGRPVRFDGNAWTPHKALRRVADHLVDHLAEIECRLAGIAPLPDHWHGRAVTTHADFARFTETDLDEATSRLTRLAIAYRATLARTAAEVLDERPDPGTWTLREVVHHVAEVTYYARAMSVPHHESRGLPGSAD